MHFTSTVFLAVLASHANFVTAAPAEAVNANVNLVERAQTKETVYLTNCGSRSDLSPPDDVCQFNTGNNVPINWENNLLRCPFSSGVVFETNMGSVGINEYAGQGTQRVPGKNPRVFDCFRDNERVLYRNGATECRAIFWCNPR
jgi:hypothetical protein